MYFYLAFVSQRDTVRQIDPEGLHGQRRLEIVDPVFLVADRAPARRRDVGLVGRRDTVRHRDVAHDRHHGRDGDLRIGTLHDGVDVERRAHEAVRSAVGAGKHRQPADLLPVIEDGELPVVERRIGHHLVLTAVMHRQAAVDILEDGAVARRIGDGQMQARLHAVRKVGRVDAEFLLREFGDRLVHRGEIVEYVLRPDAQPHDRARVARAFVDRFGQEQQVGDQPGLVHAVGDADVVAGSRQGAVFRGPEHRVVCVRPAPRRTARKDVKVGERILAPVHGTPGDCHTLGAEVDGPRAGRGFGGKKGQRRSAEHDRKQIFHKHDKLSIPVAANRMLKGTKNSPLNQTGRNLRGPAQGACHGTA